MQERNRPPRRSLQTPNSPFDVHQQCITAQMAPLSRRGAAHEVLERNRGTVYEVSRARCQQPCERDRDEPLDDVEIVVLADMDRGTIADNA